MIDASVAAKWYLPEADAASARAIMGGAEPLHAPDIIHIEVTAAILRRYRTGGIAAEDALRSCSAWQAAIDARLVLLTPYATHMAEAIGLAVRIKHPFQDCLYLALAMRLDMPLVSADPRFVARASSIFGRVEALGVLSR